MWAVDSAASPVCDSHGHQGTAEIWRVYGVVTLTSADDIFLLASSDFCDHL